ncbi:MAG: cupin domain-containing protein [Solirubrobacteraceae bacterium]
MTAPRDPNIYDVGSEPRSATSQVPGFDSLRGRIGDAAGSRRIGTSVWDLLPGQRAYPYHFHYVEEEQLIVLEGTPLLRTPAGWRRLERGAFVVFPPGPDGAHQLVNDSDETVRFIAISTTGEPDIVAYPDQGTIGVFERPPGPGQLRHFFRRVDEVTYDEGLEPLDPADLPPGL